MWRLTEHNEWEMIWCGMKWDTEEEKKYKNKFIVKNKNCRQ